MITKPNNNRFYNYNVWENIKEQPYDYERNGLINKIISPVIYNTENIFLQKILYFYDRSFVFLLKYVDILKNFKNIHWKNR